MYLTEKEKKSIVEFLKEKTNPKFIYLFGSFAKGEGREDSDIDLAIYTEKQISSYSLYIIGNELTFKINKNVEIIDLKKMDTVFAAQIVGNREELYCEDENLKSYYNMKTFREYAKLNEERQIVLNSIREDGSIYGK